MGTWTSGPPRVADPYHHYFTELLLARHGQGECNAAGVIGGERGCSGLSRLGVRQSRQLARRLAGEHAERPIEALFCSPRLRVRQTAELIEDALGLPVVPVDALRGQDFATVDGHPWLQVTAAFGGPPSSDPDRPIASGAESWNHYAERVLTALTTLLSDQAGRRVLVIGHGKTIGLAGGLLSGAGHPAQVAADFVVDHGAVSHWRWKPDRNHPSGWQLLTHNNTPAPPS